ncbi:nicotinate-nucleotide-dimethylbenzimidazole phosphoribosyltransferase [Fervidobacterium changbaicum]|uniref:Nicotinate-nucleotide--dimethylbenzimidazole phosphoribosyltransferase n=2 Tax=Fervidobacterium TaxID=2422 RepID=A0AAI8CMC3_FERIS|nr:MULTISPECIES: nicotinate-nucleotide--dimethylbenzimidazole phosphoribosyltransferase [Fervidobacterium]AMW33259.1 nicotinate-nucleotide--dimethylbenzimidazole phosphoribosyltransferase [Fervidobacterium islandicum]QAV33320.1 nicotinate-nucleotide--dimethylbenzimidazole phosphoribosyltransferase [Fervidobacterium changbaicum]SDH08608.1 nicotinate-nucleotide-dimethylbenzimidazole phosphoribosyltransferase [Fervidobacterium changbaicum]
MDVSIREQIISRLNNLTKPVGSLGYLEEIALKMGIIQNKVIPDLPKDKRVYVFASDHGVVQNGVSAYPKEVTYQMVLNFLNGGAAINVFGRHVGADVYVVDAGVDGDFDIAHPKFINAKVGYGTADFTKGPAMTIEQANTSLELGRKIARNAIKEGADLLVVGDMGIGNTTTATAIAAAFGFSIDEILDIGTPLDSEGLERKKQAVVRALEVNNPKKEDPIDILHKVGGFCMGEMAGFILEATEHKIPVIVDGFPTTAGLLIAWKMNPKVTGFVFAGHKSMVKGHKILLDEMGLRPILDLDMRLGEGTGAALSIFLIEAAIKMIREMATFESAGVSKGSDNI